VRAFRVLLLVALLSVFSAAQEKPVLTFIQITDPHVFDDGANQPADSGYRSVSADWSALHWAIQEINSLKDGGKNIDFVVLTGDLGLSNLEFGKGCNVAGPVMGLDRMPPISKDWAAGGFARELSALKVTPVYFVPGNNDLVDEKVSDAARPDCFVSLAQAALSKAAPAVSLGELKVSAPVVLKGFRLVGLNSASFKKESNYKDDCPAAGEGCPGVAIGELDKLLAASSNEPVLMFTHIPDLIDPYREKITWDVGDAARREWNAAACNGKLLGIFAGHFHDSDRNLYGSNTSTHDLVVPGAECAARKTWVAPPLAIKNQLGKDPTARGLLYVRIFNNGEVRVTVDWFGGK
jgi:hypothetical protein